MKALTASSARDSLEEACDDNLMASIVALRPRIAIGIGTYAHLRLEHVVSLAMVNSR